MFAIVRFSNLMKWIKAKMKNYLSFNLVQNDEGGIYTQKDAHEKKK